MAARPAPVSAQDARPSSGATTADAASWHLPQWLAIHGEQRTRVESVDNRYRPDEVGGDELMALRTRLQARVTMTRFRASAEVQDSRVAWTDSETTVTNRFVFNTQIAQLAGGLFWRDLGPAKLGVQLEVGRFSRDYGMGRMISRLFFANTSNLQDGVVAAVSGQSWTVHALALRPVVYTAPVVERDPRFWGARFGGVYATTTKSAHASADFYWLYLNDGDRFPADTRRRLLTPGFRAFGTFGPNDRADYELEVAEQWGEVGPLSHRARFQHLQVGYNWPAVRFGPKLLALYDYASGDEDPTDGRSGAFDTLLGRARFEMGPSGIHGVFHRSNVRSPALQLNVRPTTTSDLSIQHRWAWMSEARDRWRPVGIVDATGASGTELGSQTELRLRVRWRRYLEFDGGIARFNDGAFVRKLRPSPKGHTMYYFAGTEWRF